jgi:hypothetical protein
LAAGREEAAAREEAADDAALDRDDADREDWRATVTSVVGLGVRAH